MYFILKYVEYPQFKLQPDINSKPSLTAQTSSKLSSKSGTRRSLSATRSSLKTKSLSASKPSVIQSNLSVTPSTTAESLSDLVVPITENKEVLINPDCFMGSIIDYICEVVSITREKNFGMCTVEGDVINVLDNALSTPGLEVFEPKETYYIILKEIDDMGMGTYIPLLSKLTEIYTVLLYKFKQTESLQLKKEKSHTSTTKLKSKDKETPKEKSKVKSGGSRKEIKSILPPIKQKN